MRFVKVRIALIFVVAMAGFVSAKGQNSETQYWYPVEPFRIAVDTRNPEIRAMLERWEQIGKEAQESKDGLAGTYLKSAYRGWLLRWAPGAGFVYVFHSEGLSIIDFSYGKVEVTANEIRFIPERDMRETHWDTKLKTPLTWLAIQSPPLRFMIPADEIKFFSQYVAGLSDYNSFNGPCCEFDPFFVAPVSAGALVSSDSAITVPDAYQRFMRRPITGRIVSIGKPRIVKRYGLDGEFFSQWLDNSSLTPIALSVGRIHGIRKNMLLRLVGEQFNLPEQFIQVTSVGRQTATAVVIRPVDGRTSFPPVQPGMRITTSPILNN